MSKRRIPNKKQILDKLVIKTFFHLRREAMRAVEEMTLDDYQAVYDSLCNVATASQLLKTLFEDKYGVRKTVVIDYSKSK